MAHMRYVSGVTDKLTAETITEVRRLLDAIITAGSETDEFRALTAALHYLAPPRMTLLRALKTRRQTVAAAARDAYSDMSLAQLAETLGMEGATARTRLFHIIKGDAGGGAYGAAARQDTVRQDENSG